MQTLKFIGNGSAFNTKLGNNGAFMKFGSALFLIDCGSVTFDRLIQAKILDDVDDCHILITHFHPDHIGSLGDLAFYLYYIKKIVPKIYTPQKTLLDTVAMIMGYNKCCEIVRIDTISGRNFLFEDDMLYVEPIKAYHDDALDCYGYDIYNFETRKRIYYSGDSKYVSHSILKELERGEIDEWYQDTSMLHYKGNVHLSLELLTEEIPAHLRSKIHCMHLDSSFDRAYAESLGFNVTRNILET